MASLLGVGVGMAAGPGAKPPPASPAGAPGPSFIAHRQIEATVSKVEADAGMLLLKTGAGRLTLDAPAATTSLLRPGDRIVVDVALLRHPDPARIPRADAYRRPLLVRRLPADVAAVQRVVGIVALKTPAGRLDVDLPSAAIADLRTGDRLLLELALLHEPEVAALPRMETGTHRAGLAALLLGILEAVRGETRRR
jgi:hypothetical protein